LANRHDHTVGHLGFAVHSGHTSSPCGLGHLVPDEALGVGGGDLMHVLLGRYISRSRVLLAEGGVVNLLSH